jgi:imidazolonepropionase-like amidohydrolase
VKALAAAIALVGATVHTGDGPPLRDATLVIQGAKIASVAAGAKPPDGAMVIDASGKVVTPGLVAISTRVGVVDVELEPSSVEATLPEPADPVRAALRASDGYDPRSLTVPIARAGGISSALVVPAGGQIAGQAALVELSERDWLRRASAALVVSIGAVQGSTGGAPPAGTRTASFLRLREVLEDARLYRQNRGPYLTNRLRALSVSADDLAVLERTETGELPVLVEVEAASDILVVLEIAREHGLRVVLVGAPEAWLVAAELARAKVPVVLDPAADLPSGFSALRSRPDAAALLANAGVRVILADLSGPHFTHRLRQAAGNAVAEGLAHEAALEAITRTPAEVFGLADTGTVRAGAAANVVLWNGDPLEVTTWAERMWIRGQEVSLETRQDELTERYLRR